MTDLLSITAGVISVAGLAYSSAKRLKETIDGFSKAPKNLRDLQGDLNLLLDVLFSLEQTTNAVKDGAFSTDQKACFEKVEPALEACSALCDEFATRLAVVTSHSSTDGVDWRDRIRLHFHEREFELLQSNLQKYKQTIDIAIGVATLETLKSNRASLQTLEHRIAHSTSSFSGQLQGLEAALLALPIANISQQDVATAARVLDEHSRILKLLLDVCTNGLKATTLASGTNVGYAQVFDDASQAIGNMGAVGLGGPPVNVNHAEARNTSKQFIGSMSGEVATDFFK